MVSGVRVTVARKARVAVPKAKPMGTPISTKPASSSTKNTSRFQLPMLLSHGAPSQAAAARPASSTKPNRTSRGGRRQRRNATIASISAPPTGRAAARTMLDRPRAGVSINASSCA